MTNKSEEVVVSDVPEAVVPDYPEGGYGWVVVAASACVFFSGWGLSNAWGVSTHRG